MNIKAEFVQGVAANMLGNYSDRQQLTSPAADVPRGADLRSYLAQVAAYVEQLERSLQSLPRVEGDGRSDCPFAEDLYAQKEELETLVGHAVAMLQGYLRALEEEVSRCERNLDQIGSDTTKLNVQAALDAYDTAEQAQRDEYYQAVTDRDAVVLVLSRANGVLQVSRSRKYPGKTPERQAFGVPPQPLAPPTPGVTQPAGPGGASLGGEVGDLFQMGPLPRSG